MADGIGRDVVVDTEEWSAILESLKAKDTEIKEMLDKFIKALDILVNDGFVKGTRHDNMEKFKTEVENLRKQMNGIYDTAEKAINTLNSDVDSADKYTSIFHFDG